MEAIWNGRPPHVATVVLACGIVDTHPPFAEWRAAVADGLLRDCPICDAFEAVGRRAGEAKGSEELTVNGKIDLGALAMVIAGSVAGGPQPYSSPMPYSR